MRSPIPSVDPSVESEFAQEFTGSAFDAPPDAAPPRDAESEGLLLLTNDGSLAHKLMHPSYEVAKTYQVEIPGPVPRAMGRELKAGVKLDDGPVKVDSFRVVDAYGKVALVEVILHEGRNHIVRRMFDSVGFPVQRLIRTQLGPIRLGDLRPGRTRHLSQPEVGALYKAVGE